MISVGAAYGIILGCTAVGLVYGLINYFRVKSVDLTTFGSGGIDTPLHEGGGEDLDKHKIDTMLQIGEYISNGANAFLKREYFYVGIFVFAFTFVVWGACDAFKAPWTAICFVAGAITSIVSGWIGMGVAVMANYRTAFEARHQLAPAFKVAFRAGCVMGFILSSLALLVLTILIACFKPSLETSKGNQFSTLQTAFDQIAGYGLGGSTVALFGRVGGGIYTKAADVGADLVGKIEEKFKEDSPKNPATIADNVGDNVGDIAGMGADLFGSFAEASSAALVVLSDTQLAIDISNIPDATQAYLFAPPLLSAIGIICCLICSVFATDIMSVNEPKQIEATLKWQLIISTLLLLGGLYLSFALTLDFPGSTPPNLVDNLTFDKYPVEAWRAYVCAVSGLLAGFIIGWFTEYYTSNAYTPVQDVAKSCETGAATNIIYGLALGYLSTIIPIICLAVASYLSHRLLGLFGVALAALGMLSNLAVGLAIDSYGPISDNAGGIAEMSELGEEVRNRTDALDAAGNTTAAIGKGFAIGSAALVSLALYSAFITRASQKDTDPDHRDWVTLTSADISVTDGLVFSGLLVGAMLPYAFSAFTMKSVGMAALDMVKEIRAQLAANPGIKTGEVAPDYKRCIEISTNSALREMIAPGCLVIFTPLITGFLLGPKAVAGLLPGALVSGVQMAISASNTGGAWDNAKKYIEAGKLVINDVVKKKGSKEHDAAVIGDTVGDPLKDTSGPSLNILIKLSAILSLVFVTFFRQTAFLAGPLGEKRHLVQ